MCASFGITEEVEALRSVKCFKTNAGYKCPGECFLVDPRWGCILLIFEGFPLIDQGFYGSGILSYRNELKQTGVKVDFEDAVKVFVQCFRQQASAMKKENVLSFLSCYRKLKDTPYKFPQDLKKCIRETKWLRTRLGDYRVPSDCILYGPEWQSVVPITLLPFIDDSDNYYGKVIHEYTKELKSMGVVIDFKDGVDFVAAGLYFPGDPSCITPSNVLALLECFRILLQDGNYSFPDSVRTRISKKWLKTYDGYRPPDQCLLFDSKWGSYLKCTDGPFVDEGFYGSNISSYRKELKDIGVVVDVGNGCPLIAGQLDFHLEFSSVGEWVSPGECVLRDKDGLFSSQLQVLEKHYEQQLLVFFSSAFHVKHTPSVDDYCELWKVWEGSGNRLSHADCCKFWAYVLKHWNAKTERTLADSLVKLPVGSDSDGILLSDKQDVFIADDLQLKDLFQRSSPQPIFVWYPERNLPSLPRTKLLEIYRKIGVRTISESVEREEASVVDVAELNQVNLKEILIKKGLVRLILGFLADPVMKMEAERRHEAVRGLLDMTILETNEPLHINYSLSLTSREIVR
ncbi:hypothetical protein CJ030_MR6G023566 [Morella rubra]|uniref:Sacsin n=1 Tax=Morella rubra TaxID=262757 RepID=A0A6A1VDX2_9ROSI|nr:hypothetical protein CJ030_MR6G023566 [Morella rubra]